VGVNEATPAGGNRKMMLAGPDTEHQHVAGQDGFLGFDETAGRGDLFQCRQNMRAKTIAGGQRRRTTNCLERRREQADAVDAVLRASPVQAKARADERFRRAGQGRTARGVVVATTRGSAPRRMPSRRLSQDATALPPALFHLATSSHQA